MDSDRFISKIISSLRAIIFILTFIFILVDIITFDNHVYVLGASLDNITTKYSSRLWNIKNGLPRNTVLSIAQTKDGYLWLATEEGLARFDGTRFKVFHSDNTDAFISSSVRALCTAGDGSLWIGLRRGGLIRYKDDHFRGYYLDKNNKYLNVWSVCEGEDGSIWAATDIGLYRLMNNSKTLYTSQDGLSYNAIFQVINGGGGKIWIVTWKGELNLYKNGKFCIYSKEQGMPECVVRAIYRYKGDGLLIATSRNGLIFYESGKFIAYQEQRELFVKLSCVLEDSRGDIWVGGYNGLFKVRRGDRLNVTSIDDYAGMDIRSIYEDRDKNLWIGALGNGLSRFSESIFSSLKEKNEVVNNDIMSVFEDSRRNLWVGTFRKGCFRISSDGEITYYSAETFLGTMVTAFFEDREGTIWVGTSKGLYNLKNDRFGIPIRDELITAIIEDKDGSLWIGSYNGLINYNNGKIKKFTREDGLADNFIHFLYLDYDGTLWIGTESGGLNLFKNGRFKVYGTKDGMSSDSPRTLYKDGVYWIGTPTGFNRFKNGKFTRYTMRDGLINNFIHKIFEDKRGNLWISCNIGVFRVSKKELNDFADKKIQRISPIYYDENDGMSSSDCTGGAQDTGCLTRDGKMIFPTSIGITILDPDKVVYGNKMVQPIIEELVVDGKKVKIIDNINLPAGSKNIEFHYTVISFKGGDKVKFKYQLEGFDEKWVDAGARREAYYMNLPPGNYTFKVIACNSEGTWNYKGTTLKLYLQPYFYQTIFFYIASGFIFIIVLAGLYIIRFKHLEAREKKLAAVVEERTQQLKETNMALEQANKTLEKLVNVDGLTGVYNRRYFTRIFKKEWRRNIRESEPISLIMIDIDFFKLYNDNYGHQAGDDCLKRVGKCIMRSVKRTTDFVARYGGEEFVVILPYTDLQGSVHIAQKMRIAVEAMHIKHNYSKVSSFVTISLGIATVIPEQRSNPRALLNAADRALYKAKKNGRNRVESEKIQSLA